MTDGFPINDVEVRFISDNCLGYAKTDSYGRYLGLKAGLYIGIATKDEYTSAGEYDTQIMMETVKHKIALASATPIMIASAPAGVIYLIVVAVPHCARYVNPVIDWLIRNGWEVVKITGLSTAIGCATAEIAKRIEARDKCMPHLERCLENPWQPEWNVPIYGKGKDCSACYRECKKHLLQRWSQYKCPEY